VSFWAWVRGIECPRHDRSGRRSAGSFTNHFASKEAFGLELVNIYYKDIERFMPGTLLNDALPPLKRLRLWAEGGVDSLNQNGHWNGCLLGNFGAEANSEVE
jgi:TetR/AcrR family transcriptional repressor of nem operon